MEITRHFGDVRVITCTSNRQPCSHSAAVASASSAAALETSKAVEDARSKVTKLWGADQLSHKEKVKELEDRLDYQSKQIKGLKIQISNTSSDFKSVNTEKAVAVNSARAELQERHDSENSTLCVFVKKMADHFQVVLPAASSDETDAIL